MQAVHHARHRSEHVGSQRRGFADRTGIGNADFNLVPDQALQRVAYELRSHAWEDAAVDRGGGRLRQGIVGVAAAQQCRYAGRAGHAGIGGVAAEDLRGLRVLRVGSKARHRQVDRSQRLARHDAEILACLSAPHHRKLVGAHFFKCIGELVDGVVAARPGTVATRVVHGQLEAAEGLLSRLQLIKLGMAILLIKDAAAGITVEHELGIDQFAMILDQIIGGIACSLLIAREGEDQIARGDKAFGL